MTKSVFISSTSIDLQAHRQAVSNAIAGLNLHAIEMKHFGARPGDAIAVSLEEVRQADFYIGILAYRYGHVPDGMNKSVTEQEFDEAQRHRIPRLMYLIDPAHPWDVRLKDSDPIAVQRLEKFKQRVNQKLVRSYFTTSDDLAQQVTRDLARLLLQQRRYSLFKTAISGLILIAFAALGLVYILRRTSPEPPQPSLAYEFLVDTSANMQGEINGVTRAQIVAEAVEQVVAAPGLDTRQIWRGLRLAGGGDQCDQTRQAVAGIDLSAQDFMNPLINAPIQGSNAYEAGIRRTFDDFTAEIPADSDIKVVFIILGSLELAPCQEFDFVTTLYSYKQVGISTTFCTFTLLENTPAFEEFRRVMLSRGFGCVHNVETPEEISTIALRVMENLIEEQNSDTDVIVEALNTPSPVVFIKPSDTAIPTIPVTSTPEITEMAAQPSSTITDSPQPPSPTNAPPQTPAPPSNTPPALLTINSEQVNVRAGPGIEYSVVAIVAANEVYTVLASAQDRLGAAWYLIEFPEGQGWVAGAVSEIDSPQRIFPAETIPAPPPATNPPSASNTPAAPTNSDAYVKADAQGLRLRSEPSSASNTNILTTLDALDPLGILARTQDGIWYQVISPDLRQGWVMSQYVALNIDYNSIQVLVVPTSAPTIPYVNIISQSTTSNGTLVVNGYSYLELNHSTTYESSVRTTVCGGATGYIAVPPPDQNFTGRCNLSWSQIADITGMVCAQDFPPGTPTASSLSRNIYTDNQPFLVYYELIFDSSLWSDATGIPDSAQYLYCHQTNWTLPPP